MTDENPTPAEPVEAPALLKVITPDATPEEVAAVVAVFAAMGGGAPAPAKPRSQWVNPAHRMRSTHPHGPGAWRASALTR